MTKKDSIANQLPDWAKNRPVIATKNLPDWAKGRVKVTIRREIK